MGYYANQAILPPQNQNSSILQVKLEQNIYLFFLYLFFSISLEILPNKQLKSIFGQVAMQISNCCHRLLHSWRACTHVHTSLRTKELCSCLLNNKADAFKTTSVGRVYSAFPIISYPSLTYMCYDFSFLTAFQVSAVHSS